MNLFSKPSERARATAEGTILVLSALLAAVLTGRIGEAYMTTEWFAETTPGWLLALLILRPLLGAIGQGATVSVRFLRQGMMLDVRDVANAEPDRMSERPSCAHERMTAKLRRVDGALGSIGLGLCILLIAVHLDGSDAHPITTMQLIAAFALAFLLFSMLVNGDVLRRAEDGQFGRTLGLELLAERDDRLARRGWMSRHPRERIDAKITKLLKRRQ